MSAAHQARLLDKYAFDAANCATSGGPAKAIDVYSPEDQQFLVLSSVFVIIGLAGYAVREVGLGSAACATATIYRAILVLAWGMICWWGLGYAFAFGDKEIDKYQSTADFIGTGNFFGDDVNPCEYADFLFQWTRLATVLAILTGALGGRMKLSGLVVVVAVLGAFVYPTTAHWVYSLQDDAWLTNGRDGHGYIDIAGSGVVHMTGGIAALVACIVAGRRSDAVVDAEKAGQNGSNTPLVGLGFFMIFIGFLGLNGGAAQRDAARNSYGVIVLNTVLAGVGGAITVETMSFPLRKKLSLPQLINGGVAGFVAVASGAPRYEPWAAFVVGMIAALVYKVYSIALSKIQLDDATDAVAVHFGAGFWGLVATSLFSKSDSIFYDGSHDRSWEILGWQLAGGLTIATWAGMLTAVTCAVLKAMKLLRVRDAENLDSIEFGAVESANSTADYIQDSGLEAVPETKKEPPVIEITKI
eukprot:m.427512 g.427512  ORF g.427512 m.427512 type:complete len:471 (-) comp21362_c0_seq1:229-1641(-)